MLCAKKEQMEKLDMENNYWFRLKIIIKSNQIIKILKFIYTFRIFVASFIAFMCIFSFFLILLYQFVIILFFLPVK